jgi:DNA-binding NarL/FixJ family response regulator
MARILIADDHAIVRQGIRTIVQARPGWEICGEAKDGREAIQLANQLNPDVIILDTNLHDGRVEDSTYPRPEVRRAWARCEVSSYPLPSRGGR